jgi:hypothetical protein
MTTQTCRPEILAERQDLGPVEFALVGEDGNAFSIVGRGR